MLDPSPSLVGRQADGGVGLVGVPNGCGDGMADLGWYFFFILLATGVISFFHCRHTKTTAKQ